MFSIKAELNKILDMIEKAEAETVNLEKIVVMIFCVVFRMQAFAQRIVVVVD